MLNNLKFILGTVAALVVLGLGLYIGYHFGARKVENLENQIKAIQAASNEAEAKLKKTQDEMDKTLKDKEAEFAKQAQQLKTEADQRAKDLTAALGGANARIKSLQGRMASIVASMDAKRAQLASEMSTASAADRKRLQDQIDALEQDKKAVIAKVLGNECLTAAVPEEVIRPLIARTAFGLEHSLVSSAPDEVVRHLTAGN